jgi:N-acetylmuramoyl-L-alanine amidase
VVSPGESLSMIAVRYRISLASLRGANQLRSDTVKIGQVLNIPATTLAATP